LTYRLAAYQALDVVLSSPQSKATQPQKIEACPLVYPNAW
jgi:hypothetical protein